MTDTPANRLAVMQRAEKNVEELLEQLHGLFDALGKVDIVPVNAELCRAWSRSRAA